MKKQVMKKWVKALRSGEYKQGKGYLVNNKDEFCCLGVLCNIAPDYVRGEWIRDKDTGEWEMFGDSEATPRKIMKWSGLKDDCGEYDSDEYDLAEHNDNGKSFTEIADIIEQNWEAL